MEGIKFTDLADMRSPRAQELIAQQRNTRGKNWSEWRDVDIYSIKLCLAVERQDAAFVDAVGRLLREDSEDYVVQSIGLPSPFGEEVVKQARELVGAVRTNIEARLGLMRLADRANEGIELGGKWQKLRELVNP